MKIARSTVRLVFALCAALVAFPACDSDDGPSLPPGVCRVADDCGGDEVCRKEVGECAATAVCVDRPDACTAVFQPVCGCDGETYPNSCEALSAGVSVASDGEC